MDKNPFLQENYSFIMYNSSISSKLLVKICDLQNPLLCCIFCLNLLPHMPILGSSNVAANINMMSKIWTNGVQLCDCIKNIVGQEYHDGPISLT